jgi:hypothetical protein
MIELRWLCEKVKPYHKTMKLQYRSAFGDWTDVPEVWKNEDELATLEQAEEFAKKRNYDYGG